jgi:hypothetical protein
MNKTLMLTGLAALTMTAPAIAETPEHHGTSGDHAAKTHSQSKSKHCKKTHSHAYIVRGALVSQARTTNPDGTVDGTIVVNVEKVNHHARADKGVATTYTLDDAKLQVTTEDRNKDGKVDQADAAAGDRVKLQGKITRRNKKCSADGFTATKTFRRVTISAPEPAPAPAPAPAHAPAS